jgi:hypothetical protein
MSLSRSGSTPTSVTLRVSRSDEITAGTRIRVAHATTSGRFRTWSRFSSGGAIIFETVGSSRNFGSWIWTWPGIALMPSSTMLSTMPRINAVMNIIAHTPTAIAASIISVRR